GSPAAPLDAQAVLAQRYGGDAAWYAGNIPLFASSDPQLDDVWYYRWALYRAHQRDTGEQGYLTTEFFDDVGWQREPWAGLNDASGFHIAEGRWLRQRRFAGDYIGYLYAHGGNDRHFSEAIADAVWGRYLADGDRAAVTRYLPEMQRIYAAWDDHFDKARGLYWIEPLLDATEYTVTSINASGGKDGFRGGDAFRPSINAYMVANARAISRIAALAGQGEQARLYADKAETLRKALLTDLWSPGLTHFVDRYKDSNAFVKAWDQIDQRELVGYLPWAYGVVGSDKGYDAAWRHLLDADQLGGPHGLRTAEPSYRYYMRQYRYDKDTGLRECQWNGPVWPFQTTQALMALATMLHDRGGDAPVARAEYWRLLRQYAALHRQADGRLDLEEDYDPATGAPIVGLARSHHYFHSGFNDLVVTGLVGIVPSADDRLILDPLLPASGEGPGWFALQDLPYHGHLLTVTYDRAGDHFHQGAGLKVWLDGRLAGQRATAGRMELAVPRKANPDQPHPIDLAVQLLRNGWPHVAASSGGDAEKLHQLVDGRISFFRELPNGWVSARDTTSEWVGLSFEKPIEPRAMELALVSGEGHALPTSATVWTGGEGHWRKLAQLRPDGRNIYRVALPGEATSALKVSFGKKPGTTLMVSEIKVF
ncbi:MGH1-like glycoside hydrolase domain-containing protein, partial [Novosphingobium rosa]|uniref:MGH1-like glycoside hydrolase domain-containing protein n=1 Tax=Novosphingobium rosa TaxID=76978 RepID=UPI00083545E7